MVDQSKIGAEMGKALGLPGRVNAVMEKHIRGGLTDAEAIELNLPVKDYTLHTLEERIIIYADRLVDITTEDIVHTDEEIEAEEKCKRYCGRFRNTGSMISSWRAI